MSAVRIFSFSWVFSVSVLRAQAWFPSYVSSYGAIDHRECLNSPHLGISQPLFLLVFFFFFFLSVLFLICWDGNYTYVRHFISFADVRFSSLIFRYSRFFRCFHSVPCVPHMTAFSVANSRCCVLHPRVPPLFCFPGLDLLSLHVRCECHFPLINGPRDNLSFKILLASIWVVLGLICVLCAALLRMGHVFVFLFMLSHSQF